jgi:AraC-like DNA-binding protein
MRPSAKNLTPRATPGGTVSAGRLGSLPTASGGIARAACTAAKRARLDVRALLRKAELTPLQAAKPHLRIPVKSQIRFLNEVAAALPDDLLGVHLAQSMDLRELGLLYYVAASSETLGDALIRLTRYSAVHNEGVRLTFRQRSERISIGCDYVGVSRVSDRHQMEFFSTILVRLCRAATGRQLSPDSVRFAHSRATVPAELVKIFACDIEFGARADEVIFPLSAKSIGIANADPFLNRLLMRYCDEIMARRRVASGNWQSRVENAIAPLLPHGEATLATVAQRLGVSRRTLSRRLAMENLTFSGVLNELRRSLAKRYLQEQGLKMAEVAWLLGYQEFSAFSHACKRWTGLSPRELRLSGWQA